MINVLHVTSDLKFVGAIDRFLGDGFSNWNIVVGEAAQEDQRLDPYREITEFVQADDEGVEYIVRKATDFDLMVVHDLNAFKVELVNRIDHDIVIAWRLFGYELYNTMPHHYYTDRTKRALGMETGFRSRFNRKRFFNLPVMRKWRGETSEFDNAVKRIDIIFGAFEEEYKQLKHRWGALPRFVRFPLDPAAVKLDSSKSQRSNRVIVGNNGNSWNNHLDILDIIYDHPSDTRFVLPSSYSAKGRYHLIVKDLADKISNVELMYDFIPRDSYIDWVANSRSMIHNGLRQVALGNVFMALGTGLKLYLNKNNVTIKWLRRNGFIVYDIGDFEKDIIGDKLDMSPEDGDKNCKMLSRMMESYGRHEFQDALKPLVRARAAKSGRVVVL